MLQKYGALTRDSQARDSLTETTSPLRDSTSFFSSLGPSYAASPMYSPREMSYTLNSPESLGADLAKRLAEVESEAKQAELARRMADVDAEAKLMAATKREVEAEFTRCRQTIEAAYSSVLTTRLPNADEVRDGDDLEWITDGGMALESRMDEASWRAHEQKRRDQDVASW